MKFPVAIFVLMILFAAFPSESGPPNLCQLLKHAQKMEATVTAYYAPHKNQKKYLSGTYEEEIRMNGNGKLTSSGKIPEIGHIAADKNVFPFGTVIFVPGYGKGVVEDTGSKIKGVRLDIFMGHGAKGLERAVGWGIKKLEIYVLKLGD